ncbi:MAG: DUF1311 domain-containing protein [Planctomycetota bacterium]|nr:DUF1311 domain-containing protein [Planctomycetota bacterium]
MRHSRIVFAAIFTACAFVQTSSIGDEQKTVRLHQKVILASIDDPGIVVLKDGTELTYKPNRETWSVLGNWTKDQTLTFIYNSEFGMRIQDSNGGHVTIFRTSGTHPIKTLQDRWENNDSSTYGVLDAQKAAYKLWDLELNRTYKRLMKGLKSDQKKALRASQRKWIAYRDAEIESVRAIYGQKDGTMWGIVGSASVIDLTKSQMYRLSSYERDR